MGFVSILKAYTTSRNAWKFIALVLLFLVLQVDISYYHSFQKNIFPRYVRITQSKATTGVQVFDLSQELRPANIYENITCVDSSMMSISTTLCVHNLNNDAFVSSSIVNQGVWERHIMTSFLNFAFKNPDSLILDIGAQLGQYSLYAAKQGHYVLAVEPFIDNVYRLHKSAYKERLYSKITLIQNAISNKRNQIKLLTHSERNIGGQTLFDNREKTFTIQDKEKNKYLVETILFDDIVPYLPKKADGTPHTKAIMKIDIEGFEPYAFQNASKLFDTLDIQIIYMEWAQKQARFAHELFLVEQMVQFLKNRSFKAYDLTMVTLNTDWNTWPMDIIWFH